MPTTMNPFGVPSALVALLSFLLAGTACAPGSGASTTTAPRGAPGLAEAVAVADSFAAAIAIADTSSARRFQVASAEGLLWNAQHPAVRREATAWRDGARVLRSERTTDSLVIVFELPIRTMAPHCYVDDARDRVTLILRLVDSNWRVAGVEPSAC
jgi:hypothetical protein